MAEQSQHRLESKMPVVFDSEHLPFDEKKYMEMPFGRPHNLTLYMGAEEGVFPEGFGIRLRYYSEKSLGEMAILSEDDECVFEIKYGEGDDKKKIRIPTSLKEAMENTKSKDDVLGWLEDSEVEIEEELIDKIGGLFSQNADEHESGLRPLSGVRYERKHFIQKPENVDGPDNISFKNDSNKSVLSRLTFDSDVSGVSIAEVDGSLVLTPVGGVGHGIIEKKSNVFTSMEGGGQGVAGKSSEDDFSKFEIAKEAFNWPTVEFSPNDFPGGAEGHDFILNLDRECGSAFGAMSVDGVDFSFLDSNEFVLSKAVSKDRRLLIHRESGLVFSLELSDDRKHVHAKGMGLLREDEGGGSEEVDFEKLTIVEDEVDLALFNFFKMSGLHPRVVGEERGDDLTYLDNLPESTHARAWEYEREEGRGIAKSYDVFNSIKTRDELKAMYDRYREEVGILYRTPTFDKFMDSSETGFVVMEEMIEGKTGSEVISAGNLDDIEKFFREAIKPLTQVILPAISLDESLGIESPMPVGVPLDFKPDNFVLNKNDELYFVDFFTPWIRKEDGKLDPVFSESVTKNLVFGDFHVMMTKFLLWSVKENPEIASELGELMQKVVSEYEPTGNAMDLIRMNAQSGKVRRDFSKVLGGIDALDVFTSEDMTTMKLEIQMRNKVDVANLPLQVGRSSVVDSLNKKGSGKDLVVEINGKEFIFPGFMRVKAGEKIHRFVPFVKDDPELVRYGSESMAALLGSFEKKVDLVILPQTTSKGIDLLDKAVDIYRNDTNEEVGKINFHVVKDDNAGNMEVSWVNREVVGGKSVNGFTDVEVEAIRKVAGAKGTLVLVDDIRRGGRTETTILKLLSLVITPEELHQMLVEDRLKVAYLCDEYDPEIGPVPLGKNSKVVFQIPFERMSWKVTYPDVFGGISKERVWDKEWYGHLPVAKHNQVRRRMFLSGFDHNYTGKQSETFFSDSMSGEKLVVLRRDGEQFQVRFLQQTEGKSEDYGDGSEFSLSGPGTIILYHEKLQKEYEVVVSDISDADKVILKMREGLRDFPLPDDFSFSPIRTRVFWDSDYTKGDHRVSVRSGVRDYAYGYVGSSPTYDAHLSSTTSGVIVKTNSSGDILSRWVTEQVELLEDQYTYAQNHRYALKKEGVLVEHFSDREFEGKLQVGFEEGSVDGVLDDIYKAVDSGRIGGFSIFRYYRDFDERKGKDSVRTVLGVRGDDGGVSEVVTIIDLDEKQRKKQGVGYILKWKSSPKNKKGNALERQESIEKMQGNVNMNQLLRDANEKSGEFVEVIGQFRKHKKNFIIEDEDGHAYALSIDEVEDIVSGGKMRQVEVEYIYSFGELIPTEDSIQESIGMCMSELEQSLLGKSLKLKKTSKRKIDFVAEN